MGSLEEKFQESLSHWKDHCSNKGHFSDLTAYLDCNSYREIVTLGREVLPLIKIQLEQEIKMNQRYENELDKLERKIFGSEVTELSSDNYIKLLEDKEYQEYQKRYNKEIISLPGELWAYAVHQIVGNKFR